MVESAMEFLRIARDENYHQIVLSMKSSNPQVMVHAYRLLVKTMFVEFGECYPLHLGVTEAGDGEDGRIKSAVGIGTLLEDGLGDTIRVSLTEDPELEIPVCRDIITRYKNRTHHQPVVSLSQQEEQLPYSPLDYQRRKTNQVDKIGYTSVPVVVADYTETAITSPSQLEAIGYKYDIELGKWNITDSAADFIYASDKSIEFPLPGTLQVICNYSNWLNLKDRSCTLPLFQLEQYLHHTDDINTPHFVVVDANSEWNLLQRLINKVKRHDNVVLCVESNNEHSMASIRRLFIELMQTDVDAPVILCIENREKTVDEQLIDFATNIGGLMLDGFGDGVWIWNHME